MMMPGARVYGAAPQGQVPFPGGTWPGKAPQGSAQASVGQPVAKIPSPPPAFPKLTLPPPPGFAAADPLRPKVRAQSEDAPPPSAAVAPARLLLPTPEQLGIRPGGGF